MTTSSGNGNHTGGYSTTPIRFLSSSRGRAIGLLRALGQWRHDLRRRLIDWAKQYDYQVAHLDPPTRVSNVLERMKTQGELDDRLYDLQQQDPDFDQHGFISFLNQKVKSEVRDDIEGAGQNPLRQITLSHRAKAAELLPVFKSVDRARAWADGMDIASFLILVLLIAATPPFLAASVINLFDVDPSSKVHLINSWMWVWVLAASGLGILYSLWNGCRRLWARLHPIYLWGIWIIGSSLPYLVLAWVAFSYLSGHDARHTPLPLISTLHDAGHDAGSLMTLYLTTVLMSLAVILWLATRGRLRDALKGRVTRIRQSYENQRGRFHADVLNSLEQQTDALIAQKVNDVVGLTLDEAGLYASVIDEWSTTLPRYTFEGAFARLSEQYEAEDGEENPILGDTAAARRLWSLIDMHKSANVGIAGERGIGKTSLMYSVRNRLRQGASRNALSIWLSAPTAISEREFLLTILAKVATNLGAVLTRNNSFWPQIPPEEELKRASRRRVLIAITILIGISVGIAIGLALWPQPETEDPVMTSYEALQVALPETEDPAMTWYETLEVALAVALAASLGPWMLVGLLRFALPGKYYGQERGEDRLRLYRSEKLLEELWFEERERATSSASVGGMGVGLVTARSKERVRRPFTLAHLVQLWDDFVTQVVAGPHGAFDKLVIFIDEVDKIKDTEEIGRFMRILKALFKPMNLYFVVSISEDAYEQFVARAAVDGRRNEFDSSFDEIFKIEAMSYCEMIELLNNRIIGTRLPYPFMQLVWAISRGNPRDCIRVARDLVSQARTSTPSISDVAPKLIVEHYLRAISDRVLKNLRDKLVSSNYHEISRIMEISLRLPETDNHQSCIRNWQEAIYKIESSLRVLEAQESVEIDKTQKVASAQSVGNDFNNEGPVPSLYTHMQAPMDTANGQSAEMRPSFLLQYLRVGLYYALTLLEIFQNRDRTADDKRFQAIHKDERLILQFSDFHRHTSGLSLEQAWNAVATLRDEFGLPLLSFRGLLKSD